MSNDREAAISAFKDARAAKSDEGMAAAQTKYDAALDAEDAKDTAKAEALLNDLEQARSRKRVFSGGQLIKILALFKAKPGFDADRFLRHVTRLVETYLLPNRAEIQAALPSPSEQRRDLAQLQGHVRKTADILKRPSDIRRILQVAAVESGGSNPGLARLDGVISHLNWLSKMIDLADEMLAASIQKAGPREDRALHEFVRELDELYRENAADPRNPYVKRGKGRGKHDGLDIEGHGELMWLIDACLQPVGINLTRVAIVDLWRRATGKA